MDVREERGPLTWKDFRRISGWDDENENVKRAFDKRMAEPSGGSALPSIFNLLDWDGGRGIWGEELPVPASSEGRMGATFLLYKRLSTLAEMALDVLWGKSLPGKIR